MIKKTKTLQQINTIAKTETICALHTFHKRRLENQQFVVDLYNPP